MRYETITYEVGAHIARITLNRPEVRNALNDQMAEELLDAFDVAKADDDVRVIVLTGAGDRAFCAGADLGGLGQAQRSGSPIAGVGESAYAGTDRVGTDRVGTDRVGTDRVVPDRVGTDRVGTDRMEEAGAGTGRMGDGTRRTGDAIRDSAIYRLFTSFSRLGKPIIGRLSGHAIAGGLGLAVSCDLVIAADDVKLGTPEVNVGLWPMMIMAIINRNIAPKQAFKLYYTGQMITAREGREIGLVTEVVSRAELDARVEELARIIAAKSPLGLRLGRNAFFAIEGRPFEDQIAYLLGCLVELAGTDNAKEGIAAFLEKRTPDFKGH